MSNDTFVSLPTGRPCFVPFDTWPFTAFVERTSYGEQMEKVDYTDTFIMISPDAPNTIGQIPLPRGGKPTIASAMYDMIASRPYQLRSSDVIFTVWADRNDIPEADRDKAWSKFYSKSRPCLRSCDLVKRYGWGIHANSDGLLALYAVESEEYDQLAAGTDLDGNDLDVVTGMRSKRK